jgi:penicillin-binding protein 2
MRDADPKQTRTLRFRIFTGLVIGVVGVLGARLVQLQVVDQDRYAEAARDNAVRARRAEPARGRMFDRHRTLLVGNEATFTVDVLPYLLPAGAAPELARLLGLPDSVVAARVDAARRWNPYRPSPIVRGLPLAGVARLEEALFRLPGVSVAEGQRRRYGPVRAAHTVGTLGEVGPDQLERLAEQGDYAPGDLVGQTGMEKAYDALLRGRPGARFDLVDVRGRAVGRWRDGEQDVAPVSGYDLTLTLDAGLQALAESLFVGKRGAAVALDPQTGGVLALVSAPDYDPALLAPPIDPAAWRALNTDPERPLFDRALLSAQPLGSTIKPLMGLAGLEEGAITPETTYPCTGAFTYGGRRFGGHGNYGPLDVADAVRVSCNEFFYALGLELGLDRYSAWGRRVGFGEPMPTDFPDQSPGLWPDSAYFDRTYGEDGWTRGYLVSLGIGQGNVAVTPMQLARYTAALANGGTLVAPHAARLLRQPDTGDEVRPGLPRPTRLGVDPRNLAVVRAAMRAVVTDGTARVAAVEGVPVAGKTGTAQNPQGEDHSLFIAFAPYSDRPADARVAVAVFVENAGFGSTAAAPIASLLIERYLTGALDRPEHVPRLDEDVRSEPLDGP